MTKKISKIKDDIEKQSEQSLEYERMILFFKYLVLFFMCEALKENKSVIKKRTLSRERELSVSQTKNWFRKDNKILQFYCYLAKIDIDDLFEEFELRKKNKIIDDYLKPKFFKNYNKLLVNFKNILYNVPMLLNKG